MLGQMSSCRACCDGEMQERTSEIPRQEGASEMLIPDRYWEAKLAVGHVPSEA
jgi:hypothetical protein